MRHHSHSTAGTIISLSCFGGVVFHVVFQLKTGIGGSNLRMLEGGENLEFSGAPELEPFH